MREALGLTDAALEQALVLTRDHAQLMVDLAVRLEPHRQELQNAWTAVYRQAAVREPLPPEAIVEAIQEHAGDVLFGGLRQGDVRKYYTDIAAWASELASSGLSYDRVVVLSREYQHTALPFLMQAYPIGAQLELVLSALDDLRTGTLMLIGAVYIETAQVQLIDSTRFRTLGQLSAGATHAFSNLLTGILGHTQLLLDRDIAPEIRQELAQIQRAATVGAQMTRRWQDYANATPADKIVETDVDEVVRQAAELTRFVWRDQSEANGIVVDVVKDFANVPPVLARPGDLRQVFVALILNAAEAMPRGGLISLRTDRHGDDVLISVVDTGEGMSEAVRRRVFDPFFTTKGSMHPGLGLYVARNFVQQHGGTLHAETEAGRGSTFTVSLPVAPGVQPEVPEATRANVSAARILIVDDEPTVRDILAKFLEFRGYAVTVAEGGSEGIAAARRSGFDVVLTDLGMPGKTGWDVAREVKRASPTTLVVLMTGWTVDLDPDKARERGVDRIVHKPFDVSLVDTLVAEAIVLRDSLRPSGD